MGYLESWREEKRSAFLYRVIAEKEKGSLRETLFSGLAREAEKQAGLWVRKMGSVSQTVPKAYAPDFRARAVAALVRTLGPKRLRTVLSAMKIRGMSVYDPHAGHESPTSVEEIGRRHKGTKAGGNLRAAVFGVNDGLVSNAGLIFGVVGGGVDSHLILLAGVAGLLAGALSMAAGEFVSVKSQREMYEYQIGLEREELEEYPEQEAEELALIYQAKGLSEAQARTVSTNLIANKEKALDTLAREELGLDPHSLGSPWSAAAFSFIAFALGATVPLAPFFLVSGGQALIPAIGLTALALFLIGVVLTLFTGKNATLGGLRMLAIGAATGAVTYLIGRILNVSLS